MKEQCYKFISKNELKPAPDTLTEMREVDEEMHKCLIFNPDEEDYNRHGYYAKKYTSIPDNNYSYTEYWDEATPERPYHLQCWEQGEKIQIDYETRVIELIREKYSLDEELAIQRQRNSKPDEFQEYFNYCEDCKYQAKREIFESQE